MAKMNLAQYRSVIAVNLRTFQKSISRPYNADVFKTRILRVYFKDDNPQ